MANASFLQAALDLLGRPGNAVRGGLIAGPQGALQGLTGEHHFDGTELPGINQLPDEGLSLGPLHLTPRTVAGFAGSTLLDPLTYVGGGLGKGLGLAGRAGDDAGGLLLHGAELPGGNLGRELGGALQGGVTVGHGYAGDAMSDPIEKLIDHANSITPGHEIVADSPEAAESAVADQTGSEAGHAATRVTRIDGMTPNPPPSASVTPFGDQRYAKDLDRVGQVRAQLGEANGRAIPARQWLTETSRGTIDRSPQTWEDVVGVDRGTDPDAVVPRTVNPDTGETLYRPGPQDDATPRRYSEADLSQGPGLTSQYNGETVGFSRQEVMNHLSALENQIADLTAQLRGTGGQLGKVGGKLVPIRDLQATKAERGLDNYVSDRQAIRQLSGSPELQTARQDLMRTSTSSLPGLSPKQETLAYIKAGANQLSKDESDMRKLNNQFRDRPEVVQGVSDAGGNAAVMRTQRRPVGDADDEANLPMVERNTRAPHGDPLEEERALRAEQDKFGRKGVGTYRASEDLGHMDNERGPGAGGVRGHYESGDVGTGTGMDAQGRFGPGQAPVHVIGTRVSEPMAGGTPQQLSAVTHANPRFDEQAIQAEIEMAQLRNAIQRTLLARLSPNRFLGR